MYGRVISNALLRCRCGQIFGQVQNAAPRTVNRVICYCADCQAFLHHLHRAELLNAHGGTDIIQVAPSALTFQRGREHIAGLRLTEKGLFRFYADCCKTPLGNTLSPRIPFIGLVAQLFASGEGGADELCGKPIGSVYGKYAVGTPPAGFTKFNPLLLARSLKLVLAWSLRGKSWPHPFFERQTGAPLYPIKVLSRAERDALRPLCGGPGAG